MISCVVDISSKAARWGFTALGEAVRSTSTMRYEVEGGAEGVYSRSVYPACSRTGLMREKASFVGGRTQITGFMGICAASVLSTMMFNVYYIIPLELLESSGKVEAAEKCNKRTN